jgi:ATP-dependent exoDNAse (exonuclease V) alpha subunit
MDENLILDKVILNEEQKKAIKQIQDFIKLGNSDEWFVLEGKAGVGKTTVITHAIQPFLSKKRIVLSALSHKAKNVVHQKVKELTFGDEPRGLLSLSVASMLGMTFDLETGQFVKIYTRKKPKIKNMDIIIVDECSMINEMGLSLIMSEKKKTAKVIFLGDVGQLPPIREDGDKNGEVSPTFNTINRFKLYNRVRQFVDSKILPYSDYYWENSVVSDDPVEDPIPLYERESGFDLIFKTDLEETIKENVERFLELKNPKKQDLIKVIVYKNKTREMINWYIRDLIYNKPKEYEVGDILIFNDNYGDGDEILIENSTEVSINSISNTKFNNKWVGYIINVTDGFESWDVEVLSKETYPDYNKYISELFKEAKSLPFGRTRTNRLKNAWSAKRRFANIDFGYAITSHKSQGSTYRYVIVVEDDILSVAPITSVEKSQSLYTAITRASDKVFIVSELNE